MPFTTAQTQTMVDYFSPSRVIRYFVYHQMNKADMDALKTLQGVDLHAFLNEIPNRFWGNLLDRDFNYLTAIPLVGLQLFYCNLFKEKVITSLLAFKLNHAKYIARLRPLTENQAKELNASFEALESWSADNLTVPNNPSVAIWEHTRSIMKVLAKPYITGPAKSVLGTGVPGPKRFVEPLILILTEECTPFFLQALLSEGANPNIFDRVGMRDVAVSVINNRANGSIGWTPLMLAFPSEVHALEALLHDYGADLNLRGVGEDGQPARTYIEIVFLAGDYCDQFAKLLALGAKITYEQMEALEGLVNEQGVIEMKEEWLPHFVKEYNALKRENTQLKQSLQQQARSSSAASSSTLAPYTLTAGALNTSHTRRTQEMFNDQNGPAAKKQKMSTFLD